MWHAQASWTWSHSSPSHSARPPSTRGLRHLCRHGLTTLDCMYGYVHMFVSFIESCIYIYIQTSIRVMNPFIQRSTNAYNFIRLGAAMNSVAGTAMDITVDSVSIAAINSRVGAHLEHTSTPQPTCSPRITVGYKEHLNIFCLVC